MERNFGVWLKHRRIGDITLIHGVTTFRFRDDYVNSPNREVLGLVFEDDLLANHKSKNRLPPWFSNLLPEGKLRQWIASDSRVDVTKELDLIVRVGHDLPGAVRIADAEMDQTDISLNRREIEANVGVEGPDRDIWRFSLAGVAMKFSMLQAGDRFTAPGVGEGGDWIVKLPDNRHANVPVNEHAMMLFAREVGIEVPEVRLIPRERLDNIPDSMWPNSEDVAFAIRRFDRTPDGDRVHIEDFAQVRGIYPERKYLGSFETLASLIYRGNDAESLLEFVRRLAFNYAIGNGDAHLKNWSLIYIDPRRPVLAPAYDLVSTAIYKPADSPEDFGLKFVKSKSFDRVSLAGFERLGRKIKADSLGLADEARNTLLKARSLLPYLAEMLAAAPNLQKQIMSGVEHRLNAIL
jgi:serine/threonine-protein kinase HipA